MRRPYGTPCVLSPYDCPDGDHPSAGDYIQSTGGSLYLVTGVRANRNHPNRLRLQCVRTDPAELPADATVYGLQWYPRERKRCKTT